MRRLILLKKAAGPDARLKEQTRQARFDCRGRLDVYGHELAFQAEIKQLLTVTAPSRLAATGIQDLTFQAEAG